MQPPAADPRELLAAAFARHQAGAFPEAEKLYREIIAADPRHVDGLHLLGALLAQRGDHAEAIAFIGRALAVNDRLPHLHNNIGASYRAVGETAEAATHYRRAVELKPDYAEAHNNLAAVLEETGKYDEAVAACRRAMALKPDYAKPYHVYGNILHRHGKFDDAASNFERALALAPQYAEAANNLGTVRRDQGRLDDAVACYERAVALKPGYANALYNLGLAREDQGRIDAALEGYDKAIAADPNHADAHWNKALLCLLRGDYAKGWAEYEWRWRRPVFALPAFDKPRWDGGDPRGKTILLLAEQGYGDTIQFIRYAKRVKEQGARVLLQCPPALVNLMRTADGIDQVIAAQEPLPAFDAFAPLLSLPHLYNTSVATVPGDAPYLGISPEAVSRARGRLAQRPGLNVGLVWRGNPANTINGRKSIPLDEVARLCAAPGVNWVSLQADAHPSDIELLARAAPIQNLGSGLSDWAETAALVKALDLVISIDTGVAHLAGALAHPVWVPLSFIPDWRWLLERADSPWYPSARLFRQPRPLDWASVIDQLVRELKSQPGS